MVWRSCCLFLALLLVLPVRAGSKNMDDDEEESRVEDPEEDDEDEDDDDDEPPAEKLHQRLPIGRRVPAKVPAPTSSALGTVTRTVPRRPLECYVCAYKKETQMRSCLDPTKYRVHTMICHSPEDKCFTSVIAKDSNYEAVMRGCRSGCIGTPETTCCDINRCNNQALAVPVAPPHVLTVNSKSSKPIPPSILFFVTVLLLLQTVGKVAFV